MQLTLDLRSSPIPPLQTRIPRLDLDMKVIVQRPLHLVQVLTTKDLSSSVPKNLHKGTYIALEPIKGHARPFGVPHTQTELEVSGDPKDTIVSDTWPHLSGQAC